MTPGARIQASIELVDQILTAWLSEKRVPADKLLQNYFASHRYIGSKDRGQISEIVYWVLRHKAALEWWLDRTNQRIHGRTYVLAALVLRKDYNPSSIISISKDSQYSPPPLTEEEEKMVAHLVRYDLEHEDMAPHARLNYPAWMDDHLTRAFGPRKEEAMRAMNEQAHTDLRVNTLKTTREELKEALNEEGFACNETTLSPIGLRLEKRGPVFTSETFKKGWFEVQDEGSQMVALLVDAQPGMRVIDFCAGAGGKTLAMAAQMKNKGRILALDTSEKRLSQIAPRIRRAGVDNVQTHIITSESDAFIKRHKQTADRVLVDAPCSGSGTWRRNPDIKWRFTPKDLEEVCALQQSILQSALRLVKPGGYLIYATCSVLKEENEMQIEQALKSVNNFKVVCAEKIWDKNAVNDDDGTISYLSLAPHEDGVDGFFAAVLKRTH
ncbi:MAG: RsmB/NOP family class I SAM-dependent RNA methyltransferase [Rickettsiales bacterium]|nr:RsmB/NOP family class I SAM-dependent RNA methyltransferase [Rickettsiales bacterium]